MSISLEEVDRISKLARLKFNDVEKQKFTEEISKILDYVGQVTKLSEKLEAPSVLDASEINLMRDDVAEELIAPDEFIKLAPSSGDGFYKVKSVFE